MNPQPYLDECKGWKKPIKMTQSSRDTDEKWRENDEKTIFQNEL